MFLILWTVSSAFAQPVSDDDELLFLPSILAKRAASTPSSVSLCRGFTVNDKQNRPMRSMLKPSAGASYVDAVFGSTITRISDSSQISSGIIKTLYSTIQAWNADESLMILWHRGAGHYLYDGQNYRLLSQLPVSPVDIEELFWSTSNPDLVYYPNGAIGQTVSTAQGPYRLKGNELMSYNVASQQHSVIKDFNAVCPGADAVTAGGDVQMMSYDDDVFGLRCGTKAFSYQRSNDTITLLPIAAGGNAPSVFPSGKLFYHQGHVLNQQLAAVRSFDLASANEHSSVGRLANGNDASTGQCRVLVGQANGYPYTLSGTHISALAHQRPGWAAVSSVGYGDEGDTALEQELYLVNSDPNQAEVCRIAHHRSAARYGLVGYFAEPHPVLSRSGTRVLFNSDWNNSGSVDVYVVELAGYKSRKKN